MHQFLLIIDPILLTDSCILLLPSAELAWLIDVSSISWWGEAPAAAEKWCCYRKKPMERHPMDQLWCGSDDVYLHTNCRNSVNMVPHVHRVSAYASQRQMHRSLLEQLSQFPADREKETPSMASEVFLQIIRSLINMGIAHLDNPCTLFVYHQVYYFYGVKRE